jgi:hypothetical protein
MYIVMWIFFNVMHSRQSSLEVKKKVSFINTGLTSKPAQSGESTNEMLEQSILTSSDLMP